MAVESQEKSFAKGFLNHIPAFNFRPFIFNEIIVIKTASQSMAVRFYFCLL